MTSGNRGLLLIGSPKPKGSTSESLGMYLLEKLRENGVQSETVYVHKSIKSDKKRMELLGMLHQADIVVAAFPLYVDSLPSPVIKMMEFIADHQEELAPLQKKRFVCIVNSGFPESHQSAVAVAICRQFAKETGFTWAGGLQLGGGEAISGRPLKDVKGMARNVIKSLDLAASSLAEGGIVTEASKKLMAKPLVPYWLYRLLGTMGWKREAKQYGADKLLYNKPYEN